MMAIIETLEALEAVLTPHKPAFCTGTKDVSELCILGTLDVDTLVASVQDDV